MTKKSQERVAKDTRPPNISGTKECCENCSAAVDRTVHRAIIVHLSKTMPGATHMAPDETICMMNPDHKGMKLHGWCRQWGEKMKKA